MLFHIKLAWILCRLHKFCKLMFKMSLITHCPTISNCLYPTVISSWWYHFSKLLFLTQIIVKYQKWLPFVITYYILYGYYFSKQIHWFLQSDIISYHIFPRICYFICPLCLDLLCLLPRILFSKCFYIWGKKKTRLTSRYSADIFNFLLILWEPLPSLSFEFAYS